MTSVTADAGRPCNLRSDDPVHSFDRRAHPLGLGHASPHVPVRIATRRRFHAGTERGEPRREKPIDKARFRRLARVNSFVSPVLVYGLTAALYPWVFHDRSISVWRIVAEGAAVLMLYDFFYYFVHRYPFHQWKLLRRVHSVHHVVKFPSAIDSLYLHPLENVIGLSLLWGCTALVAAVAGPVSIYSFAWAFAFYSVLNIAIHAGLKLPAVPFAPNQLPGRAPRQTPRPHEGTQLRIGQSHFRPTARYRGAASGRR